MLIVSKDRKAIVNVAAIASIHIGHDGRSIKTSYQNRDGCQLGIYASEKATQIAMELLAKNISMGNSEIYFMPQDADVDARIGNMEEKWHHATGKKTKGHGGS